MPHNLLPVHLSSMKKTDEEKHKESKIFSLSKIFECTNLKVLDSILILRPKKKNKSTSYLNYFCDHIAINTYLSESLRVPI